MTRIVINRCFGGFTLSDEACALLGEEYFDAPDRQRCDPTLVAIVTAWGQRAAGRCARLAIAEVPDDVDWVLAEYDGMEWVAERHRTWSGEVLP